MQGVKDLWVCVYLWVCVLADGAVNGGIQLLQQCDPQAWHAQDGMKLPSLPSLGLSLPPDDDDLSLEEDDLPLEKIDILAEAEALPPPALQGKATPRPAEPAAELPSAAAAPALYTGIRAAPEPESPAAQVLSRLPVLPPSPGHSGFTFP